MDVFVQLGQSSLRWLCPPFSARWLSTPSLGLLMTDDGSLWFCIGMCVHVIHAVAVPPLIRRGGL